MNSDVASYPIVKNNKILFGLIKQDIDAFAQELESFFVEQQKNDEDLTVKITNILDVKADFINIADKLNIVNDANSQLIEFENRIAPFSQQLQLFELAFIELQNDFSALKDLAYDFEVLDDSDNSNFISNLDDSLMQLRGRKELLASAISQHIKVFMQNLSEVINDIKQAKTDLIAAEKQKEVIVPTINDTQSMVNEELSIALAKSLYQNRILENELIKATAQLEILKEIMHMKPLG